MPTGICRDFIAGAQFPTVRRTLVSNCPCRTGALYAATKYAIEGYSESLDHELRTKGIRVSVIGPADTKTPFDANFLESDAKLDEYRGPSTINSDRHDFAGC